jgi:16S rRNA (cytosine967-C5)-methyltransferase
VNVPASARSVAFEVVRDVFPARRDAVERGAQAALDYRARRTRLSPRETAFATELAYGAIKMRRALDWYLRPFLGERAGSLPPAVREILRLAAYELLYTRADEHAAVFEWVNIARRVTHRGLVGLVNAVLRSLLRERPHDPQPEDFDDPDDYLGTRYSLPTWLVRQWRAVFGGDLLPEICAAVAAPAQSALTIDRRRRSREDVLRIFAEAGRTARPSAFVEETLVLDSLAAVHEIDASGDAAWWVQSESSAMVVDVLQPQPGETILDLCSGRGNKALQIAARMNGEGCLFCVERDERKAETLQGRLAAHGVAAAVIRGDAAAPDLFPPSLRFDRILVDAPCSGTGVVGRHPEARWKKHPDDGARWAPVQRAILERAISLLQPGGVVVYAVCSLDPRETVEVVRAVERTAPVERGLIPGRYEVFMDGDGDLVIPPGIDGRDGFFIARRERPA